MNKKAVILGLGIGFLIIGAVLIPSYMKLQEKALEGSAADPTASISPTIPTTPPTRNKATCISYQISGESIGLFLVEYKYTNGKYDTEYEIDGYGQQSGNITLNLPAATMEMTAMVTAISSKGIKSEPLAISSKDWWEKVKATSSGCAYQHDFQITAKKNASLTFSELRFTNTPMLLEFLANDNDEKKLIQEKWADLGKKFPKLKRFVINDIKNEAIVEGLVSGKESEILFYYRQPSQIAELHFAGNELTGIKVLSQAYYIKETGYKAFTERIENLLSNSKIE